MPCKTTSGLPMLGCCERVASRACFAVFHIGAIGEFAFWKTEDGSFYRTMLVDDASGPHTLNAVYPFGPNDSGQYKPDRDKAFYSVGQRVFTFFGPLITGFQDPITPETYAQTIYSSVTQESFDSYSSTWLPIANGLGSGAFWKATRNFSNNESGFSVSFGETQFYGLRVSSGRAPNCYSLHHTRFNSILSGGRVSPWPRIQVGKARLFDSLLHTEASGIRNSFSGLSTFDVHGYPDTGYGQPINCSAVSPVSDPNFVSSYVDMTPPNQWGYIDMTYDPDCNPAP